MSSLLHNKRFNLIFPWIKLRWIKERKKQHCEKFRYFNISIAEAKLVVGLEVLSLTKVEVSNFRLLFDSWAIYYVSAICEKVSYISTPMSLSPWYSKIVSFILRITYSVTKIFLLEELQLSINCYVSVFSFNSPILKALLLFILVI